MQDYLSVSRLLFCAFYHLAHLCRQQPHHCRQRKNLFRLYNPPPLFFCTELNTLETTQDKRKGRTVFSGGLTIPKSAFVPVVSGGAGDRIPASVRGQVKQANLFTALNLNASSLGTWNHNSVAMELFFKGSALHIARYPNYQQFVLIGTVPKGS